MKHRWIGKVEPEPLSEEELLAALDATLPGIDVKNLRPMTGGFRNRNYQVGTGPKSCVLRIYAAGDRCAWKEQRLAELVAPEVETPKYLDIVEVGDRVVAIREFVEGTALHELLRTRRGLGLDVGARVGRALASIHRIEFDDCGELDENLEPTERFDMSGAGFADYARRKLEDGAGLERLGTKAGNAVVRLLERRAALVDVWEGGPGLIHGDYGPTNLVLTETGSVSVLDWEFGCSGRPALDFGNLMRPPLEGDELTARGIAEGYRSGGGSLPKEWQQIAQLVDLIAWVEFASRPRVAELVIADARARIDAAIRNFRD